MRYVHLQSRAAFDHTPHGAILSVFECPKTRTCALGRGVGWLA